MLSIKNLFILVMVGSATALPQLNGPPGKYSTGGHDSDVDTFATTLEAISTYTIAAYDDGNRAATTPTAITMPSSTPAPPAAQVEVSATPSISPSVPVVSSGIDSSSGIDYMAVVDEWRAKLSLGDLTQNDILERNALKTVQEGNGQMVHENNRGSSAQVLAPGSTDEFEKVFVGGWLCERPDLGGLGDICTTMSQGWAYDGQTGHADILVSPAYSQIGCAQAVGSNSVGIWGCDLA